MDTRQQEDCAAHEGGGLAPPLLLCALAGPLSREEARRLAPGLLQSEKCREKDGYIHLAEQPAFPELKRAAQADASLPALLKELDGMRGPGLTEYTRQSKKFFPAAARRALVEGDDQRFRQIFAMVQAKDSGYLKNAQEMFDFWSAVLGPRWAGHECVPPGEARKKLVRLLGCRYTLQPADGVGALPITEMPTLLQLGMVLARGDRPLLEQWNPATEEERNLRAACLCMMDGDWRGAAKRFTGYFRWQSLLMLRVYCDHTAPLLFFAILCSIRGRAGRKEIAEWTDVLQRVLPMYCPVQEAESLIAMVHNAHLMDDVLNRRKQPPYVPDSSSLPACLPLACFYGELTAAVRGKIPQGRLVDAVVQCLVHGPRLLAYYAGSSLPGAGVAVPENLASALHRFEEHGIAPFNGSGIPLPMQEGGKLLEQLRHAMTGRTEQEEGLYWELQLGSDLQTVTALRPRMLSTAPGSPARDISPMQCFAAARTEQDLAAICLAGGTNGNSGDTLRWISALAGHPYLRLSMPGKRTVGISLRLEKPKIHIQRDGEGIHLSLQNGEPGVLRRLADTEWGVTRPSLRLEKLGAFIQAYGSEGRLSFPAEDADSLYLLLNEWKEDFDCDGSLTAARTTKEADYRIVCTVRTVGEGAELALRIQVLPGVDQLLKVAQGPGKLDVRTPQGIWSVQRDMEKERGMLQDVYTLCPLLEPAHGEKWVFAELPPALELLCQLEAAGVLLLREGKERMLCTAPSCSRLTLHCRATEKEWFDIGAELQVDEQLTCKLQELLEALDGRVGRFLPIRGGYLRLPQEMEKQLLALKSLMSARGRSRGLSAAAIPALAEALGQEGLPLPIKAKLSRMQEASDLEAPALLQAELRPYQLQGFRWLAERANGGIGACLADEMGLGKTVQVTALCLHYAQRGPSLVVAPLSLLGNWRQELTRFAPSLHILSPASLQERHFPVAGEILLASYGQVVANTKAFSTVPWNVLVLDEAQAVKNAESQRAKAVCALHASARICLTGTPVENSAMDLWSLMRFLNPLLFGTKASYRRRFLNRDDDFCSLNHVIAPLMLRRTKAEVLAQLPSMHEQVLPVELGAEERALYEAVRRNALQHLQEKRERVSVLAELMRLRRACCHGALVSAEFSGESSKMNMLRHLVRKLGETGHKALVFSQFTDVLDIAQKLLEQDGVRLERLDGGTRPKERTRTVERFQAGGADLFLISLKAGGTGLNLTAADYVIILDPWWNPATEAQAAGRSHRIGQDKPVTVYRLIAKDTVEERVLRLHREKKELAEALLSGGSLPLEALRDMLEG